MHKDDYVKWYYALVDILTGDVIYSGGRISQVINGLEPGTTFARHRDEEGAIAEARAHAIRWRETKRMMR